MGGCTLRNGRVFLIQLHGTEWIVSLSVDWEQSPKKKITFLWQKNIEFQNHNWRKFQYFLQKVFLLCGSSLRMNYSNWLANEMDGKSDSNFSWCFSFAWILEICLLLIWKYNFFKLLCMLSKVKFHLKLNFIRHCQFFF